jgi:hypothetical protein
MNRRVKMLIQDKRESVTLSRRKEYQEAAKFDRAARFALALAKEQIRKPELRKKPT